MHKLYTSRKSWIAAILSLFFPGLGHAYSGHTRRGLVWLLVLYTGLLLFGVSGSVPHLAVFYGVIVYQSLIFLLIIIDAARCCKIPSGRVLDHRHRLVLYATLAVSIWGLDSVYTHYRTSILGVMSYKLASNSMSPVLQEGDYIVVDTRYRDKQEPQIGDVVVFIRQSDDVPYVKRIAGLPGDNLEIRRGHVLRNGTIVENLEVAEKRRLHLTSRWMSRHTVDHKHVFVLGDWRDNSEDSRTMGDVALKRVVGRVSAVWFSRDVQRVGHLVAGKDLDLPKILAFTRDDSPG